MARADAILAIDQGTSSTKCLLVDAAGAVVASGSAPLGESCPKPGWVEQDPEALWQSVAAAVAATLTGIDAGRVVAVGLSTQRESILLWDRRTGEAISPLLSWQDQRTSDLAGRLGTPAFRERVRRISGLPLDPMFSALKARWLLDAYDPGRDRSRAGELAIGTVDSWLVQKFGGGHAIEIGNASRTQLLDTARGVWSEELCEGFSIPAEVLPRVTPSTGPFPAVRGLPPLKEGTPVTAILGDSHAALYGHGVRMPGSVKATYGTGSSVMGLIGEPTGGMDAGTCLTIAWQVAGASPAFAAEGNIRSAGATLRWLADVFAMPMDRLIAEAVGSAPTDVCLVPAFNGLGAPYWDDGATALLSGFKLGTARATILRAGLESIPHQVADVVLSVERTTGSTITELHADGGPSANDALMQLQADLAGLTVMRPSVSASSAYGAARLAGLAAGVWNADEDAARQEVAMRFAPQVAEADRTARRATWHRAVERALTAGRGGAGA
ncbi:FGGY family carbohydrate kinase [Jiella sonneratiae]|uniref:Glycerol kinase n=1 Tax=Jiella sonneratiae TaxID=2816856 RepID=A0ABS3IZZ9_9HYPH|nr:FGGY family carbohydrate kinase [Jiella sonneratiae]MBO0903000.1 glycerol kinase [Jiella sonneratiae]